MRQIIKRTRRHNALQRVIQNFTDDKPRDLRGDLLEVLIYDLLCFHKKDFHDHPTMFFKFEFPSFSDFISMKNYTIVHVPRKDVKIPVEVKEDQTRVLISIGKEEIYECNVPIPKLRNLKP